MRKLRLAVAVIVILLSLALLVWGLWPSVYQRHSIVVPPAEMSLPTPSSFEPILRSGG
ncbi:MAG TPA: hypothetical protein VF784_11140 [Anaerolineales bacterium]